MVNNFNIFDKLNQYQVYSLGFLWADGFLSKKGFNIATEIISDDALDIIDIFNKFVSWNVYHRTRKNWKPQTALKITSKISYEFLERNGFYPKNSSLLENLLLQIPVENIHYFYRGLFDGDGCAYFNPKQYLRQISISSSFDENWTYLLDVCSKLNMVKPILTKQINKKNHSGSVIRFCNRHDITLFYNFIYSGEQFGLSRKYKTYTDIINSYQ